MYIAMETQTNTALVMIVLTLLAVFHKALTVEVSPDQVSVTEGESFTFTCGPSNDPLELISITLNENEQPQGRVAMVNESADGIILYQYRTTTIEDHNTRIVCTAGIDRGVILLSVFYGPRINMTKNSFTIEEGMTLSIPLSIDANPQPDPFILRYENLDISITTNSSVIEFSNISRNQAGNYSLKISNNISTVMYTFTIDVTYGPEFAASNLPTLCFPLGSNVTYNCSVMAEVVGNPQPSLTADVTQSNNDLVTLSADAVMITNGSIDSSVTVSCTADNGVGETITAFGSLNFGRVPNAVDVVSIQKVADYRRVNITWREQTDAGCSIAYQGEVIQSDSRKLIKTFKTAANSVTITNLDPASQYVVSLSAFNELGSSDPVNIEVMTEELEITITALNAKRIDSNSVEVTWDFTCAEVAYLTVMIVYQRIDSEMPQVNISRSVSVDDRTIVLDLESSSRYKITLYIVATYTDLSATNSTIIDADITISMIGSSERNEVSKLLTLALVLVILCIL